MNILEESLPTLLQAAKTLQIRGLSDSVDRDSLNRLCSTNRNNELIDERTTKKRRIETTDDESKAPHSPASITENIIPKEEPKPEAFPIDFLGAVSDEDEDVKTEDIILHERAKEILDSDLAPSDGECLVLRAFLLRTV